MSELLTANDKDYKISNYKELIKQSQRELNTWHQTRNEIFLQQACEKIFSALEHYVEIKTSIDIQSHWEFSREFRKLDKRNASRLIEVANYLHRFFYEGKSLESDLSEIEKKYNIILKYLKKTQ